MPEVSRTLSEWLEVAIWPGVSADHRLDEFRMRNRQPVAGGGYVDPSHLTVTLQTIDADDDARAEAIASGRAGRPIVVGSGAIDLVCGDCCATVCERIGGPGLFADMVLECPACGALQRVVD